MAEYGTPFADGPIKMTVQWQTHTITLHPLWSLLYIFKCPTHFSVCQLRPTHPAYPMSMPLSCLRD